MRAEVLKSDQARMTFSGVLRRARGPEIVRDPSTALRKASATLRMTRLGGLL